MNLDSIIISLFCYNNKSRAVKYGIEIDRKCEDWPQLCEEQGTI